MKPQIMPMIAAGSGGKARECAEQEDAEQTAVGDGRDGEADLDDMAFAASVHASRPRWRRGRAPTDGDGLRDERAFAIVGLGTKAHVEVDDRGGRERVECGGKIRHGGCENGSDEQTGDAERHLAHDEGGEDVVVGAEDGAGVLP